MKYIALDSSPLGLLTQRPDAEEAEECRLWLARRLREGAKFLVPEIVNYELRRELLRARKSASIRRLDDLLEDESVLLIPITSQALQLAAMLWAQARQQGRPTADVHALDVDVILAAQVLTAGYSPSEFVVATTNISHISRFVPADLWTNI